MCVCVTACPFLLLPATSNISPEHNNNNKPTHDVNRPRIRSYWHVYFWQWWWLLLLVWTGSLHAHTHTHTHAHVVQTTQTESVLSMGYDPGTQHFISHHITSHITHTSLHITHHQTSHITSHHITSHHITSHHITSRHVTSHHITSRRHIQCTIFYQHNGTSSRLAAWSSHTTTRT